jgi:transcriptional regulator with XRE-family HTH domain
MLGDNIKLIRKSKNLTLSQVANKSKISVGYLSDIEKNNKTNPTMDTLEKIADALGVSINEFLTSNSFSIELLAALQNAYADPITGAINSERFISKLSNELNMEDMEFYKVINNKSLELPIELQKILLDHLKAIDMSIYNKFMSEYSEQNSNIGETPSQYTAAAHMDNMSDYEDGLSDDERIAVRAFIETYRKQKLSSEKGE